MKYKKCCLSLLILLPIITQSQISIDSGLLNNSEKWKAKIGVLIIANQLRKVSLGPIETLHITKGKKEVKRSNDRGFRSTNTAWGFVNDYHIKKEQCFEITAAYNEKDTVWINMRMITVRKGQSSGLFHSRKELPQSATVSIFCKETIIKNNTDSIEWQLKSDTLSVWDEIRMCYVPSTSFNSFTNVEILKMVSNMGDTIAIYPVKGFRDKVYPSSLPEGMVFMCKGVQIAAYQNTPRHLWIRKDLTAHYKQILGGAVISLLSNYQSSY